MSEIKDKLKRNKRKRRIVLFTIALILTSLVVYGAYVYVVTTWIVTYGPPQVQLFHPEDDAVLTENTTWFNWTGSGGSGTLEYVWYADTDPTFTSPNRRVVDLGTTDNYTADPFVDGDWYWRVEVTDGEDINVSETWHFKVQTVPDNYFPYLENASVSPIDGTTGTTFHYNITFYDLDNDTAEYVNVSIDGTQYMMSEVDASDINTTNGKNYTYTTTLSVGVHNYSFVCSDGNATNSTILYTGPTVIEAHAPVVSNPSPANESTGIVLNPEFSITVSDLDGDLMNITWYDNSSGAWTVFAINTNVDNGTYSHSNPNITEYSKTYWWKVIVTDGTNTTTVIYHFRTTSSITISSIYPLDSATNICPCCSEIYIETTQNDGHEMRITIFGRPNETDYWYDWADFTNATNGTYGFCMEGFQSRVYAVGHTTETITPLSINTWYNTTYTNFTSSGIIGTPSEVTIPINGRYNFRYWISCFDSASAPDGDTLALRFTCNGEEVNGTYREIDFNKQGNHRNIGTSAIASLEEGDTINMQYIVNTLDIRIQEEGTWSVSNTSSYASIELMESIQVPLKYNTTYDWYVRVNDVVTDNNTIFGPYQFTTESNITNCTISNNSFGGGSYAWVIGVAIVLMCVPLVFALRKKEER